MFDHCLYFNTSALARQLEREWAAAFKPFDLTPPQAFMLRAILGSPGLLQSELAAALAISRPTATRALDGLEKKDLVERRLSSRDGRELLIYPRPEAIKLQEALNDAGAQMTKHLKMLLGEEVFSETVQRVRAVRFAFD